MKIFIILVLISTMTNAKSCDPQKQKLIIFKTRRDPGTKITEI